MTTLFDVDNSSDSDDCDYEPPVDELSSDDEEPLPLSDGETETKKKSSKKHKAKNSSTGLKTEHETSHESKVIPNTIDEKKRAEDVYKSFLDEVAAEMKDTKSECMSSGISCSESTTSSPIVQSNDKNSCHSSTDNTPKKLEELTEESTSESTVVSLNSDMTCSSDSKKLANASTVTPSAPVTVKRKGLDSILGNILTKKQKVTTLTKSLMDWKSFKEEEGIEEELSTYNRGKGGYIERKRFLERSDVRSYEIERDLRLTKRPTKKNI